MKQVIVAIRDAKAEAWMNPLFFQTKAQAVRSFGDAVNSGGKEDYVRHPEDFTLFYLGEWDPESGELLPAAQVLALAVGVNLKRED